MEQEGGSSKKKLKTRQVAVLVDGVHTDVVVTVFRQTILLIITQREKVGHFYECSSDGGDGDSETFTVNTLLGSREGAEEVLARQIVQALSPTTQRNFVIGLGLKERQPAVSTLQGIIGVLKANVFWKN